jgi:hypothetical protein
MGQCGSAFSCLVQGTRIRMGQGTSEDCQPRIVVVPPSPASSLRGAQRRGNPAVPRPARPGLVRLRLATTAFGRHRRWCRLRRPPCAITLGPGGSWRRRIGRRVRPRSDGTSSFICSSHPGEWWNRCPGEWGVARHGLPPWHDGPGEVEGTKGRGAEGNHGFRRAAGHPRQCHPIRECSTLSRSG